MAPPYTGFPSVTPSDSRFGNSEGVGLPRRFSVVPDAGAANVERLDQASQNFAQAGQVIGEIVDKKQALTDELTANDAQTSFMKQAGALQRDYERNNVGQAADANLGNFQASIEELRKQTLSSLPNDRTKLMFDRGARYYSERALSSAQNHADREFQVWHDASAAAAADEFGQQAMATGDPAARQVYLNSGAGEISKLYERKGLTPEQTAPYIRKWKGDVLKGIIEQQAVDGDAQGAAALLHDYRGQMDPDSVLEVTKVLQPLLETNQALVIAQSLTGTGPTPKAVGQAAPAGKSGFDNNVGNLRTSAADWQGQGAPYNGFVTFDSPEAGTAAAVKNLRGYGNVSLSDAIYRWAPPSDNNDTEAYINAFVKAGFNRDQPVPTNDVNKMTKFMTVMSSFEKGHDYPESVIRTGVEAAIKGAPLPTALGSPVAPPAAADPGPDGAPSGGLPDRSQVQAKINALSGDNPRLQNKIEAQVNNIYENNRILTETDRRQFVNQAGDLIAQAEDGHDVIFPDREAYRLLPPDQAATVIQKFNVSKEAGTILSGYKWTTPQEQQVAYEKFLAEPGNYAQRQQYTEVFQRQAARRERILFGEPGTGNNADPGGYVQDNPTVQAARGVMQAAADAGDENALAVARQNYATQMLAVQAHIGVPRTGQHLLAASEAKQIADHLMQPNVDVNATLGSLRNSWGNYWPEAMADMRSLGKLPTSIAMVESVADPQVRTALIDAAKIPQKELIDSVPKDDRKAIDQAIDAPSGELATLGGTFGFANGGVQTFTEIKEATRSAAYRLYSSNNRDAAGAVRQAVAAVTNAKYDWIDGERARVPSGMAAPVEQSADYVLSRLQPDHLALPFAGATYEALRANPEQEQMLRETYLREVQGGHWVTNERDNGLFRVDVYGNPVMLRGPHGGRARMEIFYDNLPAATEAAPATPQEVAPLPYGIGTP